MMKTQKFLEVETALPSELRDTFRALVEGYMASAKHRLPARQPRVHYGILSDLVLSGWRKAAEAHESVRPVELCYDEL